ncbi:hypothetical protein IWQ48_004769 [Labrenzia sp. EL_13]|nr:hypothetical protein [Labrenzia sp. EL_13]
MALPSVSPVFALPWRCSLHDNVKEHGNRMRNRRQIILAASMLPFVPTALSASTGPGTDLEDRSAINHLLNEYCRTLDAGLISECAALFENAEFSIEGVATVQGRQGIMKLFSGIILYEDGTPKTKHVLTNIDISVATNRQTAAASSYLTVLQQVEDLPLQPIFSGSYADTFSKKTGSWMFASRVVSAPIFGDMSRHLTNPPK